MPLRLKAERIGESSHDKPLLAALFVVNELIVWCYWPKSESVFSGTLKMRRTIMQILKAGVLYFSLVFGAGFVLGIVRALWVVPHGGTRTAELMEAPIMLVVTVLAARWLVLRLVVPPLLSARLGMGAIALVLLLVAEFGLVLWLRGIPVAGRSPDGLKFCALQPEVAPSDLRAL